MARLSLSLIGLLSATLDGEPVAGFGYDKVRALLAYLAVESHRSHPREALAGLLWPERPDTVAQKSLSQALFRLRRAIGDLDAQPPFLLVTRDAIQFNPASDHELDVATFDEIAAVYLRLATLPPNPDDIERLDRALELYRAPFLEGFSVPDSSAFEEWALLTRERLHRQAMELLLRLTTAYEATGQIERALIHARRQLELDSWCEESHQQVMRLLAKISRRSEALAQYEACRRVLAQELGVGPGAETTRLYEQIRDGTLEWDRSSAALQLPRSPPPSHNLSPDPTPLVGRKRELARLAERCADPACRLLTIIGPGGVGKTRLATQAARDHVERFQDGVFFVDLTPVGSSDQLATSILSAMHAPSEGAIEPDRRLLEYLADKQILLILDNFEHLLGETGDGGSASDGTGLLVEILGAAFGVKLLATSRERLNLHAEWLEPLEGLEVPGENLTPLPPSPNGRGGDDASSRLHGGDHGADISPPASEGGGRGVGDGHSLEHYSAGELFLRCVRRLHPDYVPEPADVPHIARICRLLEGMPLGIELAAPWVERMPVAQIAEELAEGLDLLTTTLRDVPERHRSMRAAFDHSWRLLLARQRSVLCKLAVMRGGFTREAAKAVAGASVTELSGLAERSWLRAEQSGRYGMHELIRQYCGERLEAEHEAEAGETADQVRDRHAAYYAGYLQAQEPHINWQAGLMAQLGPEAGNLDAAWQWVIDHGRYELAQGMVMGLYHIALMDGDYRATTRRFGTAVQRLEELDGTAAGEADREQADLLVVFLLYCLGQIHLHMGHLDHLQICIARSHAILDGIVPGLRRAEYALFTEMSEAQLRFTRGEFAEALRLNHEMLTWLQTTAVSVWPHLPEVGTLFLEAIIRYDLGAVTLHMGQYDASQRWLRESLAIRENLGEERNRARGLQTLAGVLRLIGETNEAERLATEGQAFSEAHLDRLGVGWGQATLGAILRTAGRFAEAQARFRESLGIARETGNQQMLVNALNGLGAVALACGDLAEAEQLYEESRASFERLGIVGTGLYATSVIGLGNVALARRNLPQARARFREALAAPACAAYEKMAAIAGMAEVFAAQGNPACGAEHLAFVVKHPFTSHEVRERAARRLAEMEAAVPANSRTCVEAQNRTRELNDVVEELIALGRNDGESGSV